MKKNEVKVGGMYTAKVSDRLVTVRIDSSHIAGGWNATNTRTGKRIRIKSPRRLRGVANPAGKAGTGKAAGAKPEQRVESGKGNPGAAPTTTKDDKPKSAAKAKVAKAPGAKPKRLSALDAAAQVLKSAGKPMRTRELITAMAERGLWTSPAGKTPHATLYAAILREINTSIEAGKASRFRKMDRGLFAFNAKGRR